MPGKGKAEFDRRRQNTALDNGLGIEERGKLAEQRGRKVINFR